MKKIAGLIILLGLISAGVQAQKWQKFYYPLGNVNIMFPAEPEYELVEKPDANTHKYSTKQEDRLYFLSFTVHELELTNHYELAKLGAESFAEALNGDVLKEKDFKYKKQKGIVLVIMKEESLILYETIIIGQIQYQLVFSTPLDKKKKIKYGNKFLKSFKIK